MTEEFESAISSAKHIIPGKNILYILLLVVLAGPILKMLPFTVPTTSSRPSSKTSAFSCVFFVFYCADYL